MINPLGWKYYVETIERQQQQQEQVASPEQSQEGGNEQLIDMTDSQLIQMTEDMLQNVDPLQGDAGVNAMDTDSQSSSESSDGSNNEQTQTQDSAAGKFSCHDNSYHDNEKQTSEYELIELERSPDTGEMDEVYNIPPSICKHDILTLNVEGFFKCVKCNTEM